VKPPGANVWTEVAKLRAEVDELRTARSSQAMTIRDPYDNHIVAIIGCCRRRTTVPTAPRSPG
jgi:hypothetical protein